MSAITSRPHHPYFSQENAGWPGPFVGTRMLAQHIFRQDRKRMVAWALGVAAFAVYFLFVLSNLFDEAALAGRAAVMKTPAGIVMGGPGYGLDNYTATVAVANEGITWFVVALSAMSILHVVRHTRAEEENGLAELVRANAVGHQASAGATVVTLSALLAGIVVVSTVGLVLAAPGTPFIDALAMMTGSAMIALVFGGIALVMCQITAHARTARGLSFFALGLFFVIRAAGDIQKQGGSTLSWFSPFAWVQQMRPFVDLRWLPLLLAAGAIIALYASSVALSTRRDFGAGLVASKPGNASAPESLRNPFALAWKQQYGGLMWTCLGLGAMWFGTGTMLSTIDEMMADLIETNPALEDLFGSDSSQFAASFLDVMTMFAALCCAAYAVVMGQRARLEESSGRLELALAAPVSRGRWLFAQLAAAAIGSIVLLAVSVFGLWAGAATVKANDPGLGNHVGAFAVYTPAILLFLALTLFLFSWSPKFTGLSWILVAFAFIVGMFGTMLELPHWLMGISPFHWTATTFTEGPNLAALVMTGVVAACMLASAFTGFRRRDIIGG